MNLFKDNDILISVIIPVYNVESYLNRCIDSVLSQDYKNIEVLLIDDGSTDNSSKICDKYVLKDNRIKVLHKENRGPSEARNTGINNAKGDYLIFLDSDDFWCENFLSMCIGKIKIDKEYYSIIIGSAQKYYMDNGKYEYISKHFDDNNIDGKNGIETLKYILKQDIDYEWYSWRYLIKSDLIIKNLVEFSAEISYAEDVEFMQKIFIMAEKVAYIDCVFINYLFHRSGSILNTPNIKKTLDKIKVSKKCFEYIEKSVQDPEVKYMLKKNISILFMSAYGDFLKINDENIKREIKNSMYILKYCDRRFGRIVWVLNSMFGFLLTKSIVKSLINFKKIRKGCNSIQC